MRIYKKIFLVTLLSSFAHSTYAAPNALQHTIVAPKCLLKGLDKSYKSLATSNNLQLITTNEDGIELLIVAKQNKNERCGGFIDVTSAWKNYTKTFSSSNNAQNFLKSYDIKKTNKLTQSYAIKYPTQVQALLKQSNPDLMWARLQKLTTHKDRYSRSDEGVKVAHEIKAEVEEMAKSNNRSDVTSYFVTTGSYQQPSVVVKVGNSNEPGIVIGAHMDTLYSMFDSKPGADDDGSGTVTVLEVARTILSSGMHFKKPIYFVWYAAEEMGLVGSQHVVEDFQKKNIPVSEVLQLDMTGYAYKNDMTMWLYDDNTDPELTKYLETLINNYVKAPIKHDKCGYACSDHASWALKGYRAALPFEASFTTDNPDIHTSRDTIDKLSLAHMKDYSKLALAFAVELAEPV